MLLNPRYEIIHSYFNAWISRDFSHNDDYFTENCTYRECFGPVYDNLNQIKQWITDTCQTQTVLAWDIHNIETTDQSNIIVTWTFHATTDQSNDLFDGISMISFNQNKMHEVIEYACKHETYHPYQQ